MIAAAPRAVAPVAAYYHEYDHYYWCYVFWQTPFCEGCGDHPTVATAETAAGAVAVVVAAAVAVVATGEGLDPRTLLPLLSGVQGLGFRALGFRS